MEPRFTIVGSGKEWSLLAHIDLTEGEVLALNEATSKALAESTAPPPPPPPPAPKSYPIASEPLMQAKTVATILGVCPQTVYTMARDGRMPSIRIGSGKRYRFSRQAVATYIAQEQARNSHA